MNSLALIPQEIFVGHDPLQDVRDSALSSMHVVRKPGTLGRLCHMIKPEDGQYVSYCQRQSTHIKNGVRFRNPPDPMDLLTLAPTPSDTSWA